MDEVLVLHASVILILLIMTLYQAMYPFDEEASSLTPSAQQGRVLCLAMAQVMISKRFYSYHQILLLSSLVELKLLLVF